MREQLLNGERFSTRKGAQSPTERGRIHDHTVRAAQQSRGPATRSRNQSSLRAEDEHGRWYKKLPAGHP